MFIHSVLYSLTRCSQLASLDGRSYIPSPRERPRSNAVGTSTPDYFSPPADARLSVESSAGAIGTSYRGPSPHIFDSTRTPSPSQAMPKSRIISMSGPSGSAPVQLPEAPDAKARKKTAGRAAKLRGDLYCVAGRVTEGMNCYTEAITHTKNTGDLVWQAAATEANILAQVYNSWLHNQSAVSFLTSHRLVDLN